MSVDDNKICIRRQFEEVWNQGELQRVGEFFADGFVNFGRPTDDVEATLSHMVALWRAAFPDLRFTVDVLVAEDDIVMCETTFEGTHLGVVRMIPPLEGPTLVPNGRTCRVKHIHRFRMRDAKISEHFAVRDDLAMFRQLGHLTRL